MKNYYLVLTKCGHVGRDKFMPIWFPIIAEDGREAARIARDIPRVKHDHKDAILCVIKTDYDGFKSQVEANSKDLYLLCLSKHEQNEIMPLIEHRLMADNHKKEGERKKYLNRKPNLLVQSKKYQQDYKDLY